MAANGDIPVVDGVMGEGVVWFVWSEWDSDKSGGVSPNGVGIVSTGVIATSPEGSSSILIRSARFNSFSNEPGTAKSDADGTKSGRPIATAEVGDAGESAADGAATCDGTGGGPPHVGVWGTTGDSGGAEP